MNKTPKKPKPEPRVWKKWARVYLGDVWELYDTKRRALYYHKRDQLCGKIIRVRVVEDV